MLVAAYPKMNPAAFTAGVFIVAYFFRVFRQIRINTVYLQICQSYHYRKRIFFGKDIANVFIFQFVLDAPAVTVSVREPISDSVL